jgi:uncharacterized protein YacL
MSCRGVEGPLKDLILIRGLVLVLMVAAGAMLQPYDLPVPLAALLGAAAGLLLIFVERRAKQLSLPRLIGAAVGVTVALIGAVMVSVVLESTGRVSSASRFAELSVLILAGYVGLVVGAKKGEVLNLSALGGLVGGERSSTNSFNLLDTSVIIDGRIADIAESGFLGGTMAIPQFVLRELQLVADSADSLKRNRGRRGLDILQRLQKKMHVEILEEDFPHIRDVDMKLVELGKLYGCKVVTNDFNLNKVAQLNGVKVLNINELANALKPVVLPGEIMRVFVLKEGKEYNQGVAYLDDGTMVVIDNARRMISKTIDIAVTSVLQTTAGKMIFGRFDERAHAVYEKSPRDTQSGAPATAGVVTATPQHQS